MKTIKALMLAVFVACFLQVAVADHKMDESISAAFKDSQVYRDYLKDDNIEITVKDGIVTLSGTAHDQTSVSLAEATAESLPGVTRVVNKVSIENEPRAADRGDGKIEKGDFKDGWLATKISSALLFRRNVSGMNTNVDVENGVVTLRGTVESEAQKALTEEYTRDIDGVRDVRNELRIEPDADKKDETDRPVKDVDRTDPNVEHRDDELHKDHHRFDDASITAKAKVMLQSHRSTMSAKPQFHTEHGIVTITGSADNAAQKDLITKYVEEIQGVRSVVNKMTVVTPSE